MLNEVGLLQITLQIASAAAALYAAGYLSRTAIRRARSSRQIPSRSVNDPDDEAAAGSVAPPLLATVFLLVMAAAWPAITNSSFKADESGSGSIVGALLFWLVLPAIAIAGLTYVGSADVAELRATARACGALLDQGLKPDATDDSWVKGS